jgi:hypothetical protein
VTLASVTVSPWIVLPLAAAALILIAWHSTGLDRRPMPLSRKRIRQANSWVMMLCVPLFAAGASLVSAAAAPRAFVLIWTVVAMLVILSVLLAIIDALNTWRLASAARRHVAASAEGMVAIARRAARGENPAKSPQSDHDD